MKHLRSKSIMSLIYVALLSIPLVSILSRVIYVQANKNAYQSYSDTNGIAYTSAVGQAQVYGAEYEVRYNPDGSVGTYESLNVLDNKTNAIELYGGNEEKNINYISIERNGQSLYFYYTDNTYQEVPNWHDISATFYYVASTTAVLNSNTSKYYTVYRITATMGQLDNVFEYSVSKLVDENNFGKLNFFTWFSDLLLDDAQMNMTYVRFANWYMCYALLVSLMQILFLVLMWFVNFSRKLLDRGMNYDW